MKICCQRRVSCSSFLIFLVFHACDQPDFEVVKSQKIMMDTYVSVRIFLQKGSSTTQAEKDLQRVWREMAALDSLLSNYREDHEIAAIIRFAAKRPVRISHHTRELLLKAQEISELTSGAFDITVGSLTKLWGFGRNPAVPSPPEIEDVLKSVDFKFLQIDSLGSTISFRKAKTAIDVGGIAKGAIIDAAFHTLRRLGYTDFLVDAGGDLRMAAGELTAGKRNTWVVHPREPGEFFARFQLDRGAVATTGDYERYFFENDIRYHHIIDPSTGYPAQSAISTTVVAPDATTADALATAIFILGPTKGIALAEQLPNIEAMVVFEGSQDLEVRMTPGLAGKIIFLNKDITNIIKVMKGFIYAQNFGHRGCRISRFASL
jgi:thiamine biosynthesis lipoprotein